MKMYLFYVSGGMYEWQYEKHHYVVYNRVEEALEALKAYMVEKGCKQKNLWVVNKENPSKHSVCEVWNRNKADLKNYSKDIPMSGYIVKLEQA